MTASGSRIAEIAGRHTPTEQRLYCRRCKEKWPCDASILAAMLTPERLVAALRDVSASGPGWARFTGDDTPQTVEQKMRDAFAPLRAMREGFARAFDPKHRHRDPSTGRFVKKAQP